MAVKSSNALRIHWQGSGRHIEGLRNVHNTVIRRLRSPSRSCGSVKVGVHG
jgi:hypothetical protein